MSEKENKIDEALVRGFEGGVYFALQQIVYLHKTPTDVITDARIAKSHLLASDIEKLIPSKEERNDLFYQLTKDIWV